MATKSEVLPKIGSYVQIKSKVLRSDVPVGTIVKVVRITNTDFSKEAWDFYLSYPADENYYTYYQLDFLPEEIYNSPLFKALQEEE